MSKVEEKGVTTYQQVSDEVVSEIQDSSGSAGGSSNIRRRVYDALNVLRAIGIISKQKKTISWEGFPHHSAQALEELKAQRLKAKDRIAAKSDQFEEIRKQHSAYQEVALRNRRLPLISVSSLSPVRVGGVGCLSGRVGGQEDCHSLRPGNDSHWLSD
jgi:transcription factor Dp-1